MMRSLGLGQEGGLLTNGSEACKPVAQAEPGSVHRFHFSFVLTPNSRTVVPLQPEGGRCVRQPPFCSLCEGGGKETEL